MHVLSECPNFEFRKFDSILKFDLYFFIILYKRPFLKYGSMESIEILHAEGESATTGAHLLKFYDF